MNLRIAAIRESRHMTQTELADAVGSTMRKVSSWERGETPIRLEDAALIADVFECTLDELAGREWPRPPTALAEDESDLLRMYRSANPQGKSAIDAVARSQQGMEGQAPPAVSESA